MNLPSTSQCEQHPEILEQLPKVPKAQGCDVLTGSWWLRRRVLGALKAPSRSRVSAQGRTTPWNWVIVKP